MRDFWEITDVVSVFSVFSEIAYALFRFKLLQVLFVTSIESWNLVCVSMIQR